MDRTKFVKEFILNIDRDIMFTDDMPVKWSSTCISGDEEKFDLRFTFLKADPGVDLRSVITRVNVQGEYCVTDDYRHESSYWHPLENGSRSVKWSKTKKEVTLSFSTKPSAKLASNLHGTQCAFQKKVNITFTMYIPTPVIRSTLGSIPLSGYNFTEENEAHDQILVVEDKKFYVNKAILSHYSPFFNTLFNDENFKEETQAEIELKELVPKEFEVLLQVIHPTTITVNADNVEFLWKLSDRFGIATVAQMCESFICNYKDEQTGAFSVSNRLKMAEMYNYDKLKTIMMEMIDKM